MLACLRVFHIESGRMKELQSRVALWDACAEGRGSHVALVRCAVFLLLASSSARASVLFDGFLGRPIPDNSTTLSTVAFDPPPLNTVPGGTTSCRQVRPAASWQGTHISFCSGQATSATSPKSKNPCSTAAAERRSVFRVQREGFVGGVICRTQWPPAPRTSPRTPSTAPDRRTTTRGERSIAPRPNRLRFACQPVP